MKAVMERVSRLIIDAMRFKGWRYFYYKHLYARNILSTKPIVCGGEGRFEVHTLTCERDFMNTLWSLKTFYHFCEVRPRLVLYDDGSLSEASRRTFSRHFVNCQIICRERFHRDMEDFLKDHRISLEYSKIKAFYCALKLFGPMCYAKSPYVFLMDSDVLFFRKPGEMLRCIENGTPFYMSDYQDAYSYPVPFLNNLLGVELTHNINAGMIFLSKKDFLGNRHLAEEYFKKISELGNATCPVNRHEQTLQALFLSKANAVRLDDDHQISARPVTDKTISHHFVDDGSRCNFYEVGLSRLKAIGFVEECMPKRVEIR